MTQTRNIFTSILVPIALTQLVSCSAMSPANKSSYALNVAPPAVSLPRDASVSKDRVVQVRRVNISPPFDGPSLVYRTRDGTYVRDYYDEWVALPEDLFTTELVDYLSAAGAFGSVVDGRSSAPHRYALETSITSLYGDFQDPQHPRVVLSARVYLLDDSGGNRQIVYQNLREIDVPLSSASAQEFVRGAGRAYRELLEAVVEELHRFDHNVAGFQNH